MATAATVIQKKTGQPDQVLAGDTLHVDDAPGAGSSEPRRRANGEMQSRPRDRASYFGLL
jgi:hypothetical protein